MLLNGIYLEETRGCYNVPLSKINKSVVTVRRGHFMNSVFVNPGIYFYAVDAFLEISMHLFLPYLSNLRTKNEFTDLMLFDVCSNYISSREDSSLLREIRERVWSYIIDLVHLRLLFHRILTLQ